MAVLAAEIVDDLEAALSQFAELAATLPAEDVNKLTSTDADNNETKYVYNGANELTSEIDGYGSSAQVTKTFSYDPGGNETSYTDGASNEWAYVYNALDEETSVTDPLSKTTKFTYDDVGNKLTLKNPDANTTTWTYNGDNQVTGISYSDGTTHSVSYTYNPDGSVATMADASGTSTYTYDRADRLTAYENGAGATVSYGLDAAGNVTTLTYPGSHAVTYQYNALDEMTSLADWNWRLSLIAGHRAKLTHQAVEGRRIEGRELYAVQRVSVFPRAIRRCCHRYGHTYEYQPARRLVAKEKKRGWLSADRSRSEWCRHHAARMTTIRLLTSEFEVQDARDAHLLRHVRSEDGRGRLVLFRMRAFFDRNGSTRR